MPPISTTGRFSISAFLPFFPNFPDITVPVNVPSTEILQLIPSFGQFPIVASVVSITLLGSGGKKHTRGKKKKRE